MLLGRAAACRSVVHSLRCGFLLTLNPYPYTRVADAIAACSDVCQAQQVLQYPPASLTSPEKKDEKREREIDSKLARVTMKGGGHAPMALAAARAVLEGSGLMADVGGKWVSAIAKEVLDSGWRRCVHA